jgi:hypothetical protein
MFQKAVRHAAKLRLALSGPSGSGKTYSALLIASGIVPLAKVAVIDTESGSANLYANLGGYSVLSLTPPYTPQKYMDAIHAAEQEGFELIIIDSLSHAWNGEGGILDQQGKAADSKYRGNSWAAWREFTPIYNQLVETILHSKCHVIATMRSKTEYMQNDSGGKKRIVKVGAAPIQRDGIEYEFTVVFDLSIDHVASVSKDRTRLFDGQYFTPTPDVGKALHGWLDSGMEVNAVSANQSSPINVVSATTPQSSQPDVTQPATNPQPTTNDPLSTAYLQGVITLVWQKGGWVREQLTGYAMKRWDKPFKQITAAEWDALINELCQYKNFNRSEIEAEFQKSIPF